MELHYAKNAKLDHSNVFMTWKYEIRYMYHYGDLITTLDDGWRKVVAKPSGGTDLDKHRWYLQSNREDLFFAHLELQEATKAMRIEEDDIIKGIKHNKKHINSALTNYKVKLELKQ